MWSFVVYSTRRTALHTHRNRCACERIPRNLFCIFVSADEIARRKWQSISLRGATASNGICDYCTKTAWSWNVIQFDVWYVSVKCVADDERALEKVRIISGKLLIVTVVPSILLAANDLRLSVVDYMGADRSTAIPSVCDFIFMCFAPQFFIEFCRQSSLLPPTAECFSPFQRKHIY